MEHWWTRNAESAFYLDMSRHSNWNYIRSRCLLIRSSFHSIGIYMRPTVQFWKKGVCLIRRIRSPECWELAKVFSDWDVSNFYSFASKTPDVSFSIQVWSDSNTILNNFDGKISNSTHNTLQPSASFIRTKSLSWNFLLNICFLTMIWCGFLQLFGRHNDGSFSNATALLVDFLLVCGFFQNPIVFEA